jgi:AraC-like DNA-binding protein
MLAELMGRSAFRWDRKKDFMSANSRSSELPLPSRAQHRSNAKNDVHVSPCGVSIHPSGYAGPALGTSSVLADYVDVMADWDIACPNLAQALTTKVIPSTAPRLLIHYRTPFTSTWQFGSRDGSLPDYRHYATRHQTGVVVARPRGPLGFVDVRLRPEAAACLLGERMRHFLDARIGLDDLFGTSRVSLLEEMLAEARTSAERFACVGRFLAANLREGHVKPMACRAAALLRQCPHLRIRHLAARLDVSERHLSRSFQAVFGMSPKQFARIARIENVWSARSQGASWADIASAARFADQAHMINDFTEIVGVPPAQLVRAADEQRSN